MASILSSAGKVGLVTMSFGYMAARITASLSRRMDFSTAKGPVVADQDPVAAGSEPKSMKASSKGAHVQCLHTTLR